MKIQKREKKLSLFVIKRLMFLSIRNQERVAVLIELIGVLDDIAVIVRVAHAHESGAHHVDIVEAVADVEGADAAVGFHRPAQGSVLLGLGDNAQNFRNEIVVVKACVHHGGGFLVKIGKRADYRFFDTALVKKRHVCVRVGNGEEPPWLKPL